MKFDVQSFAQLVSTEHVVGREAMVRWSGFPIHKTSFSHCHQQKSRQICFAVWHRTEPKRGGPTYGTFNLPFLHQVIPFEMWPNRNLSDSCAVWRRIDTSCKFEEIDRWARHQNERVFLRDGLFSTICLGRRLNENNISETRIGELFRRAKYHREEKSIDLILDYFDAIFDEFEVYRRADALAAVPPRPGKPFDLPTILTARLATRRNLPEITSYATRKSVGKAVKHASLGKKWDLLVDSCICFHLNVEGSNIVIIDDIYQSGITLNYVGSVLQSNGANRVMGLTVTKASSNVDNT